MKDKRDDPPRSEVWVRELLENMRFSQRPTPKFSGGTCSEYWEFKRVFQRHVGVAQIPDTLKLETLLAAYAGPAKDALRGCLQIQDPKAGYKEALDILEKRHGNKHTYVCQLIKKALRGPTVRLSDAKGLQQFSDELGNCVRNLKVLGELRQIDTYESISTLAERFKGKMRDDYVDKAHKYKR
ncbi:uncharacterized protein LOC121878259, partial [Homarus americanus]